MSERTLTDAEMQAVLAGGDPEKAVEGLAERVEAGEAEALLLAADLRAFARAMRESASSTEAREFEAHREMSLARLKRELRSQRKSGRGWLRYAIPTAIAAMLILALWLPGSPGGDPQAIALFDGSSYEMTTLEFSAPPVVRGVSDDAEAWAEAGEAYAQQRFTRAAELFGALAERNAASVDARLYAGISLLAVGQSGSARSRLVDADRLAAERDLPRGATGYYLALAAIAEGDADAARSAIDSSIAAGGRFGELSRELLDRI